MQHSSFVTEFGMPGFNVMKG